MLSQSRSTILGHRGASGEFLENSYAAFEHLQDLFVKQSTTHRRYHHGDIDTKNAIDSVFSQLAGCEFDVQITGDGHLVVFHDHGLSRLYKSQSRVDQLSLQELNRLTEYDMLPLSVMPKLLTGYQHIELEIKTHRTTNHQKLVTALSQVLKQPCFLNLPITLTSFDVTLLALIDGHHLLRQYRRGLLVDFVTPQHISQPRGMVADAHAVGHIAVHTALRLGCRHISWHHQLLDAALLALTKRHDLSCSAWTVNDVKTAVRLAQLGIDHIITDYPSLFV